ncbi:MAG: transcription initiation protein [Actinobacteria bacterium]|nr:transcription initiation protein [Actinomycetota bacterium]
MKYLLVYHDDHAVGDAVAADHPSVEQVQAGVDEQAYRAACEGWQAEMTGQGVLLATMGLLPPEEESFLRVRDGRTLIADGPFAETREQMGGVSLIECADFDHARQVAASHPWAAVGAIEIRAVRG